MRAIPRLMAAQVRLDWHVVTRSAKVFFGWTVTDLVYRAASVSGLLLVAERFSGIGAWDRHQVLFLLGYVSLVDTFVWGLFNANMAFVSRIIGRGQLEHRLIQPRPLWISMLTSGAAPIWALSQLIPAAVLLAMSLGHLSVSIGPGWWFRLLVSVVGSVLIQQSFQFAWASAAFWAPVGAEEISSETNRVLENLRPFPLDGFGRGITGTLVTILPTGLIAWYPARGLAGVGAVSWVRFLGSVLLAFSIALLLFRLGLRRMFGAGIGRYTDFGHRR